MQCLCADSISNAPGSCAHRMIAGKNIYSNILGVHHAQCGGQQYQATRIRLMRYTTCAAIIAKIQATRQVGSLPTSCKNDHADGNSRHKAHCLTGDSDLPRTTRCSYRVCYTSSELDRTQGRSAFMGTVLLKTTFLLMNRADPPTIILTGHLVPTCYRRPMASKAINTIWPPT